MRFLVDECLSTRVPALLTAAGHDAVHVIDCGLAGAPDDQVMAKAVEHGRVLLSADTEFRGDPGPHSRHRAERGPVPTRRPLGRGTAPAAPATPALTGPRLSPIVHERAGVRQRQATKETIRDGHEQHAIQDAVIGLREFGYFWTEIGDERHG